ncbi:MAG: DUF1698 domain-containing protein [Verrucomicrobiae bacterium]|nr:DUF1698 domain-containing protein [Verrucomicrobiae bacterium]
MVPRPTLDRSAIEAEIRRLGPWYHKIDLGNGMVTPGLDLDPSWDNIRRARSHIDYTGRRVLDLASFDGMWAFEAERLGAAEVVALDCQHEKFKRFLFCKQVLGSEVVPYYNVATHEIADRLDVYFEEPGRTDTRAFDIVQNLGLLYHVTDPLRSLLECRAVMKDGGLLLVETAVATKPEVSGMVFNGVGPTRNRVYMDSSTWWAPTIPCLRELLQASLFEPLPQTESILRDNHGTHAICRVCLVAKAVPMQQAPRELMEELVLTYRTPGLGHLFQTRPRDFDAGTRSIRSRAGALIRRLTSFLRD